jgi:NADPH2:quinone reductase
VIKARTLVAMPAAVSDEISAANLLRGMTAEYLLFRLYAVQAGDHVLVHAAAGATGVIMCQWARSLGARVIGTVGAASRFEQAHAAGCELVLEYGDPDFVGKVKEFTNGALCNVVYDSVGKDTFDTSLACVKIRGILAAYGNGSGKPPLLDVLRLAAQGSIFVTRPRLDHYATTIAETEACAGRFFDADTAGTVKPRATRVFPLREAALAHRHLEDRDALTTPVLIVE